MEANRSKLPSLMLLCTIFGLMLYQQIDNAAAFTSVVVCRAFCSSKINANPYECATSPKKAQQSLFVLQKEKSATETSTASSGSSKSSTVTEGAGAAGDKERKESSNTSSSSDGLPWWWKYVWDLDMMKRGEPGTDIILGDSAHVLRTNIEQIYGGYPSLDGCPMAAGEITDIAEGTMFIGLQRYNQQFGSPFKFCFGPKSFLTVSDPVQMKHILRDANTKYDKGILAEILKPIMGKGLIPADPETWSVRRRAIVPAFHKAWLEHMIGLFGYCNKPLFTSIDKLIKENGGRVEMEEKFCSVALDIIGKAVFNFEFGSVTNESPVIKAVYSTLVFEK